MGFTRLRFFQFRNLQDEEISLGNAREIFLVGQNGQGKTNFLEALYLLCYGSSFRTKVDTQLCRWGSPHFSLQADFSRDGETHTAGLKVTEEGKAFLWDREPVRDRKDMVREMPCVAFTHEDYLFVQGTPEHQRFFFDQTLSLFDSSYIDNLRHYRKLLKTRNFLLGSDPGGALPVWEDQLIRKGLELVEARQRLIEEFNEVFPELFAAISGLEKLEIRYRPSWKGSHEGLVQQLEQSRAKEQETGYTTTGPHRDRYVFALEGRDFAQTASTGQVRLVSLLLRSAQARFSARKSGKLPLLLFDDVLLELDGEKRQRFLAQLPSAEQAFFTYLPEEHPNSLHDPLILRVENGRFEKDG